MPHQDAVLLIYVFSIFGLVLVLMFSSFYACHVYARRLERLHPANPAQAAQVRTQLSCDGAPTSARAAQQF